MLHKVPLPQVYKIQPLAMQSALTHICERMTGSTELTEVQRGPVMGCHRCHKSVLETSSLLNIPPSPVSGIIVKWKSFGV